MAHKTGHEGTGEHGFLQPRTTSSVPISFNLKLIAVGGVVFDRGHCGSLLLNFILLST